MAKKNMSREQQKAMFANKNESSGGKKYKHEPVVEPEKEEKCETEEEK